jgi:hypothetical protein
MSGPFADDEKCQEFAANLKSMLDAFKWQRADLAAACNFSASVISNILTFQRPPTVQQGEAFDTAFRLKDVFAKAAREIRGESFTLVFRKFSDYEREADTLLIYEHSFVPGLVQTERYARAVIETWPNITTDETERLVAGRLGRQEILARDVPPRTFMLVDEGTLRRPVAEPEVIVRAVHAPAGSLTTTHHVVVRGSLLNRGPYGTPGGFLDRREARAPEYRVPGRCSRRQSMRGRPDNLEPG